MNPVSRVHVYPGAMAGWLRPLLADREVVELPDDDAFLAALPEIEVFVGWRPPRGHWAQATKLRLVHTSGAGVDDILPAPDLPDHVQIANASGIHLPAMAEWIVAAVLAGSKRFDALHRAQRDREWRQLWSVKTFAGSTVCILGLGTIGADVARLLSGFGVRIVGTRRSGAPLDGIDEVFGPDAITEAMTGADAVVVLLPRTDETVGAVGADQLDALADGAVLVDVSRGGIVDIDAVVERLGSGTLAQAIVDVWEPEPLPADSPYWDVPGLVVTPHTAGITGAYLETLARRIADNIACLERGDPLLSPVDRMRGY